MDTEGIDPKESKIEPKESKIDPRESPAGQKIKIPSTFDILQGINKPREIEIEIEPRTQLVTPEEGARIKNVLRFFILWDTAADRVWPALQILGFTEIHRNYIKNTFNSLRRKSFKGRADRFWKTQKVNAMRKMGAGFPELYEIYWGEKLEEKLEKTKNRRVVALKQALGIYKRNLSKRLSK